MMPDAAASIRSVGIDDCRAETIMQQKVADEHGPRYGYLQPNVA